MISDEVSSKVTSYRQCSLRILALDQLVQAHDIHGTGVQCGEIFNFRVLGYTNAAVLVEDNDKEAHCAGGCLHIGSRHVQYVSTPKTFSQHHNMYVYSNTYMCTSK